MSSWRVCSMIKRAAIVLAAVTLSFWLALAPKAFADDMKKDSMSKEDSMSKDSMKKDSMSKDSMSKDAMSKDSMSKDGMKKDEMKKGACGILRRAHLPPNHPRWARTTAETSMSELLLALFAGILTIAAPCTLPVLPILLGASIGQRTSIRPALIASGFVASFAFVALALNAVASSLHFDPDVVRDAGLTLLIIFGALMIWPAAFERLAAPLANGGRSLPGRAKAQTHLGGLVLGATLGLIWTPCAGPVLGTILTAVATSPDRAHAALLLLTYATGAALPMLGVAYGGQAIATRLRGIAPYAARLQQTFGVVVIAFALSAFLQYDAVALAWLGQFFPESHFGL